MSATQVLTQSMPPHKKDTTAILKVKAGRNFPLYFSLIKIDPFSILIILAGEEKSLRKLTSFNFLILFWKTGMPLLKVLDFPSKYYFQIQSFRLVVYPR